VAPRLTLGKALAAGVALGALPWLHLRYVPIGGVLAIAVIARGLLDLRCASHVGRRITWREVARSPLWAVALPALAGLLGLLLFDWRLFGGVPSVDEYGTVSPANLLPGIPGLLLDQQFGLLVYSPVFLIGLAGLPLVAGLGRLRGAAILGSVAVYFLFIGAFSFWYGAFSPPARMLVPVIPLLVVPLALALDRWRTVWFRALFATLLALSWAIAHLLVDVPRLRYNLPDGASQMLLYLQTVWGRDLTTWLPSFVQPTARSYLLALWWAAAAGAVVWLATRLPARRRRASVETSPRPSPVPPGSIHPVPHS
jgi:hypothetical protein